VPFSPWVDMEYTGESPVSNQGKDALLEGREAIQAGIFLGESGSPQDPLASPFHASLAGLFCAGFLPTFDVEAQR
jgi:monoterpene epsilon-lactone hydrolase